MERSGRWHSAKVNAHPRCLSHSRMRTAAGAAAGAERAGVGKRNEAETCLSCPRAQHRPAPAAEQELECEGQG